MSPLVTLNPPPPSTVNYAIQNTSEKYHIKINDLSALIALFFSLLSYTLRRPAAFWEDADPQIPMGLAEWTGASGNCKQTLGLLCLTRAQTTSKPSFSHITSARAIVHVFRAYVEESGRKWGKDCLCVCVCVSVIARARRRFKGITTLDLWGHSL